MCAAPPRLRRLPRPRVLLAIAVEGFGSFSLISPLEMAAAACANCARASAALARICARVSATLLDSTRRPSLCTRLRMYAPPASSLSACFGGVVGGGGVGALALTNAAEAACIAAALNRCFGLSNGRRLSIFARAATKPAEASRTFSGVSVSAVAQSSSPSENFGGASPKASPGTKHGASARNAHLASDALGGGVSRSFAAIGEKIFELSCFSSGYGTASLRLHPFGIFSLSEPPHEPPGVLGAAGE
jgi:hypothetical protein